MVVCVPDEMSCRLLAGSNAKLERPREAVGVDLEQLDLALGTAAAQDLLSIHFSRSNGHVAAQALLSMWLLLKPY